MYNESTCPLCHNKTLQPFLECEDYTASHEHFQLQQCLSCSFIFTNPRPEAQEMQPYYASPQYISHTDQATGLIDRIYLFARKYTLRKKISLIKSLHNQPSLLDYGCGTGEFLMACQENGWSIQGVEPTHDARKKATEKTGTHIAENLSSIQHAQFDIITLWHVLEHVHSLQPTIRSLRNLLKETGILIIAIPNPACYDAHHYKKYWAAYDVPRHLWHFTKQTLGSLMQANALRVTSILPMKLDAYYIAMLSEKYASPHLPSPLSLLRALFIGFLSNLKASHQTNHSSLIYIIEK